MNFLLIKMESKKPSQQKELEMISPRDCKKGDKLFIVRKQKIFYVGQLRK